MVKFSVDILRKVSEKTQIEEYKIKKTLELLSEKNTVAFISRYRKDSTGNLDEDQIRDIENIFNYEIDLSNLKEKSLEKLKESDKLTSDLKKSIVQAQTKKDLDEIMEPFKSKKATKADKALKKGFLPVANQFLNKEKIIIDSNLKSKYKTKEIIQGALDIVESKISTDIKLKRKIAYEYEKRGIFSSKLKSGLKDIKQKEVDKLEIYHDFKIPVKKIKSYQFLAIKRGEKQGILNLKLEKIKTNQEYLIESLTYDNDYKDELEKAVLAGYNKLLKKIERDFISDLKEKFETESISQFKQNLKKLLLTKPNYNKRVLAVDPGYRNGCKCAILDENSNPVFFTKFFLDQISSITKLKEKNASFDLIILGNGTASFETKNLLLRELNKKIIVVNESGASIYSASKAGKEEFPNLDPLDRGTISIGRRYIDPLSELVKIPPESIGVGLYQHDIDQKKLSEELGNVLDDVVNLVGINVNTASKYVLKRISGLDERSAKKIISKRPFHSRSEIKNFLTENQFKQSIGFLRVPDSKEVLDNTNIHFDDYKLAKYLIKNNKYSLTEARKIDPNVTEFKCNQILDFYKQRNFDPRIYNPYVETISSDNINEGDIIEGVVRNIVPFGVFVDIGLKNDALIHLSNIANEFVKDPSKFVSVGEKIKVKIISIDDKKERIQLSLKDV